MAGGGVKRRARRSENPCWEREARAAWIQGERTFGAAGNVGTETSCLFSPGTCGVGRALGPTPWPFAHGAPRLGHQGGAGLGHAPRVGALEAGPAHGALLVLRSGATPSRLPCPPGSTRRQLEVSKGAGPEPAGAEAAAGASPSTLVLARLPRLQAAFTPDVGAGHVCGGRKGGVILPPWLR